MSRRSGQDGRIERKGNVYYVRFRMDVEGREERAYKCVRLCPVSGPGSLTKSERQRLAREIIHESGADSVELFNRVQAFNLGVTFRQQSEQWLKQLENRKRRPVKERTISNWRSHLKYLNARIGDLPLQQVDNKALRQLVTQMTTELKNERLRYSAKSIRNHVQVVKLVVGSALNEQGDELFPRKWNDDFIDLPLVGQQNAPAFSAEDVLQITTAAEGQFQILYELLAASGLRIGEALALEVTDLQGPMLSVSKSAWNGRLFSPKTRAGVREVDLNPIVAVRLHELIGERRTGFIFQSEQGNLLRESNVLRRSLHPILADKEIRKTGFHAFRRFRLTHLRKQRVPEDLIRFWMGHADKTVTDGYSRLKDDREFRQQVAESAGIGWVLTSPVAPIAPKTDVVIFAASA
jgi:integrase